MKAWTVIDLGDGGKNISTILAVSFEAALSRAQGLFGKKVSVI